MMLIDPLCDSRSFLDEVVGLLVGKHISTAADKLKGRYGISYQRARSVCHIFLMDGSERTCERLGRLLHEAWR